MGEASVSELNPEPIKDLRPMRGQSVSCMYKLRQHQFARRRPEARRGYGKTNPSTKLFNFIVNIK